MNSSNVIERAAVNDYLCQAFKYFGDTTNAFRSFHFSFARYDVNFYVMTSSKLIMKNTVS